VPQRPDARDTQTDPAGRRGSRAERAAAVEQLRKKQESAERRRTLAFVGIAVTLGVGLIAAAAIPSYLAGRDDPRNKDIAEFGVAAAAADCGEVVSQPATGVSDHRPSGTLAYDTVPPSFGPHRPLPAPFERKFYTAEDRPEMETLVHNLEHGYTVVWYDETIAADAEQLQAIKDLSERIPAEPGKTKFVASAWDDAYGALPADMHVAMSHWGAKDGHLQMCGQVSGEAINAFMDAYPYTDSPEPNGV
jgi:hypothetical protein